jgi:hypothetical protein
LIISITDWGQTGRGSTMKAGLHKQRMEKAEMVERADNFLEGPGFERRSRRTDC